MKLLTHNDLAEKGIAYSRPQLWRKCKDGSFPRPIQVGAHRSAWVEAEIDAWIAERIADRDGKAA
jgi:prophage regulatory protein